MRGLRWVLILLWAFAGASNKEEACTNSDHLETDLSVLNLTDAQRGMVLSTLSGAQIQGNSTLETRARASLVSVNSHLVYRYLQSSEWVGSYHGQAIGDAIVETVEWRHMYDFPRLDSNSIAGLVKAGLAYISPVLDKKGRVIFYVRGSHDGKKESPETYLRLLMYSVERADRMSVETEGGQGEFVVIINLKSFSIFKCPPMSSMLDGIALLKKHYPYRLAGIFIVNAGGAFDMLWKIFKPLIPARALRKTFFLTTKELSEGAILEREMGLENVELDFGGTRLPQPLATDDQVASYLSEGFWDKRAATAAAAALAA